MPTRSEQLTLEGGTSLIEGPNQHVWLVDTSARAACRLASDVWLCAVLGSDFCGLETADHNCLRCRQPLSLLRERVHVPGRLSCDARSSLGHGNRYPSRLHANSSLQQYSATQGSHGPSVTSRTIASPALMHSRKPAPRPPHITVLACQPNDERSIHSHVHFATARMRTNHKCRTCVRLMENRVTARECHVLAVASEGLTSFRQEQLGLRTLIGIVHCLIRPLYRMAMGVDPLAFAS